MGGKGEVLDRDGHIDPLVSVRNPIANREREMRFQRKLTLVNVVLLFTTGRGLLLAAAAAAHFAGHAFEFVHAGCLVEN